MSIQTGPPDARLVFSLEEIARAADVPVERVRELVGAGFALAFRGFVPRPDAERLLRILAGTTLPSEADRAPVPLLSEPTRRTGPGLAASGVLHGVMLVALVLVTSFGLLASDTDERVRPDATPLKLVFLMSPGPGGGGGGGGLKMPVPPPPAQRRPVVKRTKRLESPVPPVRQAPPVPPRPVVRPVPPRPRALSRIDPMARVDPPPPSPPAVQAPVLPKPADSTDLSGLLAERPPTPPSQGSGSAAGVGSGIGQGLGEGIGAGIGPGTGGGTGGGPFQPGSGITPPQLLREVRPSYTDDARRRRVEGDVVLDIVVRQDGSVGAVTVTRSLGAGLDQRAVEAVRQWRFAPARKQGAAVEVLVEVSVEFKLR
jgi:TonB family protein